MDLLAHAVAGGFRSRNILKYALRYGIFVLGLVYVALNTSLLTMPVKIGFYEDLIDTGTIRGPPVQPHHRSYWHDDPSYLLLMTVLAKHQSSAAQACELSASF